MSDETAAKMYESARDRLLELLKQEKEAKEQISHWAPIVEQLAKLSGATVDPEIVSRINELNKVNQVGVGGEMGLTEAIRVGFQAAAAAAADADRGARQAGRNGLRPGEICLCDASDS
jgi:hypothetical protein